MSVVVVGVSSYRIDALIATDIALLVGIKTRVLRFVGCVAGLWWKALLSSVRSIESGNLRTWTMLSMGLGLWTCIGHDTSSTWAYSKRHASDRQRG